MSGGTFVLMQKKRDKEARLKDLKASFHKADKDGDGALDKEEWFGVMKAAGFDIPRADLDHLFQQRDRDLDGKLSMEEFLGQETKVEKAFRAMDRDGNGYISKAEFRHICKSLTQEQIDKTFEKFDTKGDGKLNYREFCGFMNSRKQRKLQLEAQALAQAHEHEEASRREQQSRVHSELYDAHKERPPSNYNSTNPNAKSK